MSYVFFDFDGTITHHDTLVPFAKYLSQEYKFTYKIFYFYFYIIFYKYGFLNDKQLKESYLKFFVEGLSEYDVDENVKGFLHTELKGLIDNHIFNKLSNHVKKGDNVYIISANFDFILKPLIKEWSLSGIISTITERKYGYFTGKIIGKTCKGKTKVEKIKEILGNNAMENAIAYGDKEDSYLLKTVRNGYEIM